MSSIRRKLSWFAPVVVPRVRIRAGPALVVPGPSSSPSSAGSQGDAQTTLTIGAKILDAIDEAIRLRDKLLLTLSEHATASEWVEDEVTKARAEERRRE